MSKYDEIVGKEWARILGPFFKSDEYKQIRQELKNCVSGIEQMYPAIDDIFKAFRLCPYEKTTTIFLTTNCYGKQNDGLAFSDKSSQFWKDLPAPLQKVFDAVETDVGNGLYLARDPDLSRWAKQGVLLLNCDLTTFDNKPGAHLKLWHPFMKYLIKWLAEHNTGIVYVLVGAHPHKFQQYLDTNTHDIFFLEHPMIAVKEHRAWDHKQVFSRINAINGFIHNKTVNWIKNSPVWDPLEKS